MCKEFKEKDIPADIMFVVEISHARINSFAVY
jgi:hypothetical protein